MNMKKQIALVSLTVVALVVPAFVHAELALLTKTLKAGMRDKEILSLQSILNRNPTTLVSQNGAGSKGQETEYFGKGTLEAVKKFQKINATKILAPAGLSEPTGIVGSLTRAVINSYITGGETAGTGFAQDDDFLYLPPSDNELLLSEAEVESKYLLAQKRVSELRSKIEKKADEMHAQLESDRKTREESARLANDVVAEYTETASALNRIQEGLVDNSKLGLHAVIPSTVLPETTIIIFGSKMTNTSVLYIGKQPINMSVDVASGQTASAIIPANMQAGKYEMYIVDGGITSTKRSISVKGSTLSSKTKSIPNVVVSSVTVNKQSGVVVVTLNGYGYTNNNSILAPFKTYYNLGSNDGKTLTFVLDQTVFPGGVVTPGSFPIIVVNDNGLSDLTMVEVK